LYTGISQAAAHPIVKPVLARVAERRLAYLVRCFSELGLAAERARHRALLAYAAFGGLLHLARQSPRSVPRGPEWEAYVEHVIEALIPEAR
jgi:hypothetical protein